MDGTLPSGRIVVYDDDHYYMGGVVAELLLAAGCEVTLATPAARVSDWTVNTLEQGYIQARLLERGAAMMLNRGLAGAGADHVRLACTYTGRTEEMGADALVLVTAREPVDRLWRALETRRDEWTDAGIRSVKVIGDAASPAPIAWATYAGRRYAEELDAPDRGDALPFRRELARLGDF